MYLAENLRFIRQEKNYSQAEAAEKIGIPRTTLGDYERGHTEPNIETLSKIARVYGLKIESLISQRLKNVAWEDQRSDQFKILAISVDAQEKNNIELVRTKAAAGYMDSFQDPEYISELPRFQLPSLQGHLRAFEIEGDSMLPMEPGNIVICKYVERLDEVKNNNCYIVVSQREGVVYKRLQKTPNNQEMLCISDNQLYPSFQLPMEEIKELWEYQAHISFREPSLIHQSLMDERMTDIQRKVNELHRHYIGKTSS
ncbi:MAG: helix-turn-helix domain-containing protein [Saprospiraceae bacterium]|nr:helix-turn-helix domain-containing protein [Saprospiraceae bacterium]